MKYDFLIITSLTLIFILTFCIHINRPRKKKKKKTRPVVEKQFLAPLGKGFNEYIPPERTCNPKQGCHAGSYVKSNW